jgi:hypothetical protein
MNGSDFTNEWRGSNDVTNGTQFNDQYALAYFFVSRAIGTMVARFFMRAARQISFKK